MRKLAFALVLVMTLGLTACGGDGEEPADDTGPTGVTAATGATTALPASPRVPSAWT